MAQWGYKASITNEIAGHGFKPGGYLDATYDVKLYKNLYLQTGAGFFLLNGDHIDKESGYSRFFGLEAPLNLSLRPSITEKYGAFIDLGVTGRMRLFSAHSEKLPEHTRLLRFAVPLNLGAGVQIDKRYRVGLEFQAQPLEKYSSNLNWHYSLGITFGCTL